MGIVDQRKNGWYPGQPLSKPLISPNGESTLSMIRGPLNVLNPDGSWAGALFDPADPIQVLLFGAGPFIGGYTLAHRSAEAFIGTTKVSDGPNFLMALRSLLNINANPQGLEMVRAPVGPGGVGRYSVNGIEVEGALTLSSIAYGNPGYVDTSGGSDPLLMVRDIQAFFASVVSQGTPWTFPFTVAATSGAPSQAYILRADQLTQDIVDAGFQVPSTTPGNAPTQIVGLWAEF